jgi:hypothetical protein
MFEKVKEWLLGFRKVTVMFLILTSAVAFLISGHLSGSNFTELLKVTGAAFFASNVGEHLIKAVKDNIKRK